MNKMKGGRVRKVIGWKSADSRAACNPEMNTHRNNTTVWKRKIAKRCFISDDTKIQFKCYCDYIGLQPHIIFITLVINVIITIVIIIQLHIRYFYVLHYDKYSVVNKMLCD